MGTPTHDRSTRKPYTPPVVEVAPKKVKPKKEKPQKKAPREKKVKVPKARTPKKIAAKQSAKPLDIDSGVEVNFISKDNEIAAKNMKLIQAGKKVGQSNTTLILLLVIIVLLSGIVISMYF